MQEARLRQRLVPIDTTVNQEHLNNLSAQLNAALAGKTADEVRRHWHPNPEAAPLADLVVTNALSLMALEEQTEPERAHLEGLSHMLGQPEFVGSGRAQQAVEVLEDDHLLSRVSIEDQEPGQVRVIIGEEHRHEDLRSFGVVLAKYGAPGTAQGDIGAIGPTRMDYARAISSVRFLAQFLGSLLATLEEPTTA